MPVKASRVESIKSIRASLYRSGWKGRLRTPRHLPASVAECPGPGSPCPYVSCRHHLWCDIGASGSIQYNYPEMASPLDLKRPCALDYASSKDMTLEEIGEVFGVTRERIRQICDDASRKFRKRIKGLEHEYMDGDK